MSKTNIKDVKIRIDGEHVCIGSEFDNIKDALPSITVFIELEDGNTIVYNSSTNNNEQISELIEKWDKKEDELLQESSFCRKRNLELDAIMQGGLSRLASEARRDFKSLLNGDCNG